MTITYNNGKGIKFVIDVRLHQILRVIVQVYSTNQPVLTGFRCDIPYIYVHMVPPFDFNGTEELIKDTLELMYDGSDISNFKQEEMIDSIDMVMMHWLTDMGVDTVDRYSVRSRYTV
ncbi:putative betaC1 protein [Honeysuckle yellow vein mosaic disease associated satellite DNA beta-[Nara]]|uniref:Putative betaC1 protein n=1 Tax=Honeysuckle yellow vein mosaic disease associated satellite DNA beta-[Nara] TaxID=417194 RepID=A5LHI3_9VIRU|nr:putative betaC1 protein [Honeysuckle yellow vein mosaic disease associated satellite DNA beta-[Nara]]BAF64266.1 putative betaC1 protein [Honeysuckle yellow vein mosaic disease associated satellite DNA beta-[Nara]]